MNIIIIGCGKVGVTIAEQLNNEGHDITIVDKNELALRNVASKLDVMGINGNGAVKEVLQEAGIREADLLVAVTDSDEVNMIACLIAKKEGHCRTVARIRNPEYDREIDYLKREMNISMVVNPEKLAAHEIVRLLRFPSAREIDSFGQGRCDMVKVRLSEKSRLCDIALKDLSKTAKSKALIVLVERGDEVIIPGGMTVLKAGDIVSFLAKPLDAIGFLKECVVEYHPIHMAIIVGGGKITYYIARYLSERKSRIQLKIIEQKPEKAAFLASEFPNATVINGDGTSQQLLEEEGVQTADAIVSMTGIDEENVINSLFASKMHTKARLITKVNHLDLKTVDELQLGPVVSPRFATSYSVVRYVRGLQGSMSSNIETLYKIANGRAEAVEFQVNNDERLVNIPLIDLKLKKGVIVGAIIRNGNEVLYPGGSDYLTVGDRVVIITTNRGLRDLCGILA